MGFFDFVKEAGEKILGGGSKPAAAPKATPTATAPSAADAKRQSERELAAALLKFIGGLGLEVKELSVKVADGIATVGGEAASQAVREKVVLAAGNVQGVARVDDRMTVAKPEPEAVFYTVKPGDSLSKIAKTHYGNASKYPVIFEANRPLLSHPDKIYPGQVLRIPPQQA